MCGVRAAESGAEPEAGATRGPPLVGMIPGSMVKGKVAVCGPLSVAMRGPLEVATSRPLMVAFGPLIAACEPLGMAT